MSLASASPNLCRTLVLALVLGPAALAHAQFRVAQTLPVPGTTRTVAVAGDFNADGLVDLAVDYYPTSGIAVFLGTGPGTFAPPVLTSIPGVDWDQVAAADLNGDGRTDVVAANGLGVSRYLADGSGGFTAIPMGAEGEGITLDYNAVSVGDVNGDGHTDIVAAVHDYFGPLFVWVSLGDGAGGFGPWLTQQVGVGKTGQIAVVDVNGDGAPDVLIPNDHSGGSLLTALNDGTGAFAASFSVTTGSQARGLAVADFDGDGKLDAAVANRGPKTLSFLKGNGAGGFVVTGERPCPALPTGVVAAALDGDGRIDLAVTGGGIWTYLGNGAGGFAAPAFYAGTGGLWAVDLNADGRPDIAAGNALLFSLGPAGLAAARQFAAGVSVAALALGDMNGDGQLDIVAANAASNDVAVLLGTGGAVFADPRLAAAGSSPAAVALGDWNGDGRLDVAVANRGSNDVSILLGDGTGGLAPAAGIPTDAGPSGLGAADLNADGKPDLVLVSQGAVAGKAAIFLNAGGGSFVAGPEYALPQPGATVALGAFNPDVRPDAAVALTPGSPPLMTLLGNGVGGFLPPQAQAGGETSPKWIAVGDLNGDNKTDLAVADAGGSNLHLGDGLGGFTPLQIPALDGIGIAEGTAIADFDRDGKPDVAFSGVTHGVSLALGDGSGTFGLLGRTFAVGGTAGKAVAGDFNGDGNRDLAVAVANGNVVTILVNEAVPAGADLSVAVVHSPDPAVPQGPLTLTLTVANQGPLAATAVVLSFELPPGVTFESSTPGAPTCQTSGGNTLLSCSLGDMAAGGGAVVGVDVTVTQSLGTLSFRAKVGGLAPLDPHPIDDDVTQVVPVGLAPDLALSLADSVDPVAPGAPFSYVIDVANVGQGPAPSCQLTDTLPGLVTFVSSNPPGCTGTTTVVCTLPALGAGASTQVTLDVMAGTFTSVTNVVAVSASGDLNAANDTAAEETRGALGITRELVHASALTDGFPSGAAPAERVYFLTQEPHASYQVVVDATAGDVAGPGQTVLLQRLAADLTPLQSAVPAGVGPSRSLSWENGSAQGIVAEVVRVRSTGCGSACGPGDVYRIRAYETTGTISRFRTEGTQTTVLVLENTTSALVQGHAWIWSEPGQLVANVPFSLSAKQSLRLDLATVVPGRSGAITVSHDGVYGAIVGKGVAIEPATGFTFDTPLRVRPRG